MPRVNSDLGISLMILGATLTIIGYLVINSVPVFVLGLATIIMGLLAAWGEGSLERTQLELARSGWSNVSLILESIGTASRAIYLPSSQTEFKAPMALVPLVKPIPPSIKLPRGFAVRYGKEGEVGLLLSTPGTIATTKCLASGALSGELGPSLSNCLVNTLAVISGVITTPSDVGYTVVVKGSRINELYGNELIRSVLGSPTASLVASIAAEVLGVPVTIDGEEVKGKDLVIRLRVLAHGP